MERKYYFHYNKLDFSKLNYPDLIEVKETKYI